MKDTHGDIFFIETNIHGAIVIYGNLGIRQYYYYSQKTARELYLKECAEKLRYNFKGGAK